jgi:hypothetical protein
VHPSKLHQMLSLGDSRKAINLSCDGWKEKHAVLGCGYLSTYCIAIILVQVDRLEDSKRWYVSLVKSIFWKEEAECITSIPHSKYSQQDFRIWRGTSSGDFFGSHGLLYGERHAEESAG